jgi:glycosyltransferase involved in cell wall biosynthesis
VLARRSDAHSPALERVGAVAVRRLAPAGEGHWKKWALVATAFVELVRMRQDYDVILVSGYRRLGPAAVLAAKLLGKRCILKSDSRGELAGTYFASGLKHLRLGLSFPPFRAALRVRNALLRRADAFVVLSQESEAELVACAVSREAIWRIPNIVDTKRFRPVDRRQKQQLRRQLGLQEGHRVAIYTGRLVTYKGLPLLLRCWLDLRRRHQDVTLLLVGSGGEDIDNCEQELREFVLANGLTDSVRFTGNVTNVEEYLQAADVFAFPCENEAFGLSLVEAMACGLPVVTTRVGVAEELVRHGDNGLLVGAGDFAGLRGALDSLLGDPALSARLGWAAVEAVGESFGVEAVTGQYLDLFARIAEGQPRPGRYRPAVSRSPKERTIDAA